MAAASSEAGDFFLIITEVDAGDTAGASKAMAQTFGLDPDIAQQVLAAAPIIFAEKLNKQEVKAVTPKLVELSAKGITFRLTARIAQRIPKLHWPVRPQFTAAGSGRALGHGFDWSNQAFVCPSCGESYLFKAMGQIKLKDAEGSGSSGSSSSPALPAVASAPPPSTRPTAIAPPSPGLVRSPMPPPPTTKTVPIVEEETIDFNDADDILPAEPDSNVDDLVGVEGVDPLPGEGEPINLDDVPAQQEDLEAVTGSHPVVSATPEETAIEPIGDEMANGELYNVFLSKITERSRQDAAAQLIAKTKGCPINEAKELTSRLVIPIAKNVSKEEAEGILNDFKKIKVFGRMTRAK